MTNVFNYPNIVKISGMCLSALTIACSWLSVDAKESSLEDVFINPQQQHKPLIIWQGMDGLVTRDGIIRDLEAFRDAGLAGVQNFQIGGPGQMRIGNPDNAIRV